MILNFILTILRQYWKYKFGDIVMKFATFLIISGLSLPMLVTLLISFDLVPFIPSEIEVQLSNSQTLISALMIILGIAIGIWRINSLSKKLTGILIIHRGMEGMNTSNIKKSLPKSFAKGKLDIIDLHEGHQISESKVLSPERALSVISNLDQQLKTRLNGRDISDVKLAYAGLAPIPLLVTAGFKVTSRQNCFILDYSRDGSWHGIDDIDDQETFTIENPVGKITSEVAIILPFSVDIVETQLPNKLYNKSYTFHLKNDARPDSLNSTEKQIRIAKACYTHCANLRAKHPDLKEIHLYIASQASFAFRIGTMLTTSVMPKIYVYQFDGTLNKYTWGVSFETDSSPSIVEY